MYPLQARSINSLSTYFKYSSRVTRSLFYPCHHLYTIWVFHSCIVAPGNCWFSCRWVTLMLVRVQPSTPSWATRKYLCLPHPVTPSISRYFYSSLPVMLLLFPVICHMPNLNFSFVSQTLYVEPGLCLCDCPGLVMPSFVSTKAEMTCNGILPIDQMRDHVPPVSLISFVLSTLWWFCMC
jgi:hypothetical protein